MQENTLLYRIALSLTGGVITALLGALLGLAWAVALGLDRLIAAGMLGSAGFVLGAVSFQLTPTGGVIMENRTTVNYAVIATYCWIAGIFVVLALGASLFRAVVS